MGWNIEFNLFLSLIVYVFISGGNTQYDQGRHACIFTPEVCIPPENCNSATGYCQAPLLNAEIDRQNAELAKLLHVLEEHGFKSSLEKRFPNQDQSNHNYGYRVRNNDMSEVQDFQADAGMKSHQIRARESHSSFNPEFKHGESFGNNHNKGVFEVDKTEVHEYIKLLVNEAVDMLKKEGRSLSSLTDEEKSLLIKYLAKLVKNKADSKFPIWMHSENPVLYASTLKQPSHDIVPDMPPLPDVIDEPDVPSLNELPQDTINEAQDSKNSDWMLDASQELQMQVKEISNTDSTDVEKSPGSTTSKSKTNVQKDTLYIVIIVVGATVLLVILVTIISCIVYSCRMRKRGLKFIDKINSGGSKPSGEDYEDLCRQHYANKNSNIDTNGTASFEDNPHEPIITQSFPLTKPIGNGTTPSRQESASSHANATRNSSVSSVSWSEEPVTANLDITTGHAVLTYMEDHLNNKDRLEKEWEEICNYKADGITTAAAITQQNSRKNRTVAALPYDHNRIQLNPMNNALHSDYINASSIIDNDPKRPLYIAAQGPLSSTIPDFWQMMWEQGCVAIVMLTPLVEEGVNQCARYWPDEGSCTYHNFEIHLVSEHIWCEDYLVRSLYLKHLTTGETRTVTQFHFLSWPKERIPSTPKPLLELRRKVTKCYKGHNSPVLVHCSDGVGRTGTYILLDLAIDRMLKGAKEIDIAATLEHIRDQRVGMVGSIEQFEFALTAVAEEVNAILKTLLH